MVYIPVYTLGGVFIDSFDGFVMTPYIITLLQCIIVYFNHITKLLKVIELSKGVSKHGYRLEFGNGWLVEFSQGRVCSNQCLLRFKWHT